MANKKLTTEYVSKQIEELGEGKFHLVSQFKGTLEKIAIQCDTCHRVYPARWGNFQQGSRCPWCAGRMEKTKDMAEVVKLMSNGFFELSSKYNGESVKISVRNKQGRTTQLKPSEFTPKFITRAIKYYQKGNAKQPINRPLKGFQPYSPVKEAKDAIKAKEDTLTSEPTAIAQAFDNAKKAYKPHRFTKSTKLSQSANHSKTAVNKMIEEFNQFQHEEIDKKLELTKDTEMNRLRLTNFGNVIGLVTKDGLSMFMPVTFSVSELQVITRLVNSYRNYAIKADALQIGGNQRA